MICCVYHNLSYLLFLEEKKKTLLTHTIFAILPETFFFSLQSSYFFSQSP